MLIEIKLLIFFILTIYVKFIQYLETEFLVDLFLSNCKFLLKYKFLFLQLKMTFWDFQKFFSLELFDVICLQ